MNINKICVENVFAILYNNIHISTIDTEEQTMIEYFLGVDGGGSKTSFALADRNAVVLSEITLGSSNPNDIGIDNTLSIIADGINFVCSSVKKENISAFIGIAGAGASDHHSAIYEFIRSVGFGRFDVGSDAQNAVSASLGKNDGITVIMGTGAVAFSQKDGTLFRTGGFGYLFNDEGSGFAIGKDVIIAALKHESGYGTPSALTSLVKEKCGRVSVLESISDFYRGGKRTVAEYAPLAFEAYRSGDAVAEEIIYRNMCGIAELIRGAGRFFEEEEEINVRLCGGLTAQEDTILGFITKALGDADSKYKTEICRTPQIYGALMLAGLEEVYVKNRSQK